MTKVIQILSVNNVLYYKQKPFKLYHGKTNPCGLAKRNSFIASFDQDLQLLYFTLLCINNDFTTFFFILYSKRHKKCSSPRHILPIAPTFAYLFHYR